LRAARWLQYKQLFVPTFIEHHRNMQNIAGLYALCDPDLEELNATDQDSASLLSILGYLRDFEVTDVSPIRTFFGGGQTLIVFSLETASILYSACMRPWPKHRFWRT
jgi:hypothetical protein